MAKPVQSETCGLSAALAVIAGKWKATIVWQLHARPLRFGELRRAVPGISEKILFQQLRELEAEGVVHREILKAAAPQRVEYSLTPAGSTLNTAVHALAEWGTQHAVRATAASEPLEA